MQSPGQRIRTEVLAPALGILAAMPIYRSEWGGMGTISRRFMTCNSQVRGVPLEPQDDVYRDVEYYLSYMSNGLPISGPGRASVRSEDCHAQTRLIPLAMACRSTSIARGRRRRQRSRFQVRAGRGRSREQGSGRAEESMDDDAHSSWLRRSRPRRPADFDKAVALAKQAEALAKASIAQAKEQQDAWRAADIR